MSPAPLPRSAPPAVICERMSFSWPDGHRVFDALDLVLPPGRTGIIADNGVGKSTLLRLVAGELTPDSGVIHAPHDLRYLPQDITGDRRADVAGVLGVGDAVSALHRIETGSWSAADFELVGDDWDVVDRSVAALRAIGLIADESWLERPLNQLSGGEAMSVALAGAQLAGAELTMMDEPTNNLDATARTALNASLDAWQGSLVVVSHDRELLDHVDLICELTPSGVRLFSGTLGEYEEYRRARRMTASRRLREADAEVALVRRQLRAEQQRKQQRDKAARREKNRGNVTKGEADYFANRAQKNTGTKKVLHAEALDEALQTQARADEQARQPERIRIELPQTALAPNRRVLALQFGDRELRVDGPERIRVAGDNGTGKSTLLGLVTGTLASVPDGLFAQPVRLGRAPDLPWAMLDQRLDMLNGPVTPLDAMRTAGPANSPQEARELLARLLFTGDKLNQAVTSLSGGERFRLALACLLFARPAPQLLVLDEPTNNLDMASVDVLVQALGSYRGALLVVSHDERLIEGLRVDRCWLLRRTVEGTMVDEVLV